LLGETFSDDAVLNPVGVLLSALPADSVDDKLIGGGIIGDFDGTGARCENAMTNTTPIAAYIAVLCRKCHGTLSFRLEDRK
jgi:hypothetical protein